MSITFQFFASNKDLCEMFDEIERVCDIKYSYERIEVDNEKEKVVITENSICNILKNKKEIGFGCIITSKSQNVITEKFYFENPFHIVYTSDFYKNKEAVLFRGGQKLRREDMISDYQFHVGSSSIFAENLLKKMVKIIKKHSIKVKTYFIGHDLYRNRQNYIFYGMYWSNPAIITELGELKRWYEQKAIAEFMDKRSIDEKLEFLNKAFSSNLIQDWEKEWKDNTDNWEIYEAVMRELGSKQDINLMKKLMELFDDNSNAIFPYKDSGMQELRDIVLDIAFALKKEGMKTLIESLKNIPLKGKETGRKAIVKVLLRKKNLHKFQCGIEGISEESKQLLIEILNEITDKRLLKARELILNLLEIGVIGT